MGTPTRERIAARLRFSAAAIDDLVSIAQYIADRSGSRAVAEKFAREIRQKCRDISSAPNLMGRPRPDLRPDLRSHPHGNYVIFFRFAAERSEIVNILENHRDVSSFFAEEDKR